MVISKVNVAVDEVIAVPWHLGTEGWSLADSGRS